MCFWPDNLLLASHEHQGHLNSTSTNEELILSRVKGRPEQVSYGQEVHVTLMVLEVELEEQVVVEWTIS